MEYRQLGATGLKVSGFCLGTMTFGDQMQEAEAIRAVDLALEAGVNFVDTADIYAGGLSEQIVGRALRGKREDVVLATKVGQKNGPAMNDVGLSAKHIMRSIEESLKRLDTDYVDLFYMHVPDYSVPIEETLRVMDLLVSSGKTRYVACSNLTAWQLCRAVYVSRLHDFAQPMCVQLPYNLLTRDIEYEMVPFCGEERIGMTVYNPLAGGLLTGKHTGGNPPVAGSRFTLKRLGDTYTRRYWSKTNFEAVDMVRDIAAAHGKDIVQFSLAWLLAQEAVTSVVLGVSSAQQLQHNLGALQLSLAEEEKAKCDAVWQHIRPSTFFYGR